MEPYEKMIMFPYNDYKNILIKALILAKNGVFNENLEMKIKNEFVPGTNVIDYLLNTNKTKINIDIDKQLYTKKSPIDYKLNKKNKNWIEI